MSDPQKQRVGLDALTPPPAENGANGTAVAGEEIGFAPPRPATPPTVPATQGVPAQPQEPMQVQFQAPPTPPQRRGPRPRMITATVQPQSPLGGVAGGQLPVRKALAMAFKSNEDTILVYRVIEGKESVLPKEWPSSYLAACGLNEAGIEAFVVRYVVPDWGGGTYVVRGRDPRGETVGEATVEIAGASKEPVKSTVVVPTINQPPPGVDPVAWADAVDRVRGPRGPTPTVAGVLKEAIDNEQALRAAQAFKAGDPKTVELEKQIADLKAQLDAKSLPVPVIAPQESELDKFMKWQQMMTAMEARRAPVGPSPEVAALTEQVKGLAQIVTGLASQKAEDEKRRLEEQIKELKATMEGKTNLGRFQNVKEEIDEIRNIADQISPPSAGGSSIIEVAGKLLESWTPEAVGNMLAQNAAAKERILYATARAKLMARALPAGQPLPPEPPLKRHIPEDLRNALMEATEAPDLNNQVESLILRLINLNDDKLIERLKGVLNAVAAKNTDDLRARVAQIVAWIYGKTDEARGLVDRITGSLLVNRESVMSKFGMVEGEKKAEGGQSEGEQAADGEGEEEEEGEVEGEVVDAEATPASPVEPTTPKAEVVKLDKKSKKGK